MDNQSYLFLELSFVSRHCVRLIFILAKGKMTETQVILTVRVKKCDHSAELYDVQKYPGNLTVEQLWLRRHPPTLLGKGNKSQPTVFCQCQKGRAISVDLTLKDLSSIGVSEITFQCNLFGDTVEKVVDSAVDACERLMAYRNGMAWPNQKEQRCVKPKNLILENPHMNLSLIHI